MANTERLPDEAIESMFSGPVPSATEAAAAAAAAASSDDRRRRLIQKRLELPMGTKPAAKVIRRSPQSQQKEASSPTESSNEAISVTREEDKNQASESTQSKNKNDGSDGPAPVLGSIVERSRRSRKNKGIRKPIAPTAEKRTGFPSLNAPIGTYIGAKQQPRRPIKQSNPNQSGHAIPPTSIDRDNNNIVNDNNVNRLHRETTQEADAILSQMSAAEIDESKRELEQALSPDMIQFLRQRHQRRGDNSSKQTSVSKQSTSSVIANQPTSTTSHVPAKDPRIEVDEALEKAKVKFEQIASIRSYDELDLVYQRENGGEQGLFYFEEKGKGEDQENDTLQLACDLLRSSVPRQNLWAARTIRNILQRDLQLHLKKKIMSGQSITEEHSRKYPVTLPVSLRCLLDAPASQRSNNGYALHTYVLESIHLLLRMLVVPDHDVDVAGSLSDAIPTLHVMYQAWFADDAVPSIPIDQCYQKSNKVKAIEVLGSSNAAYAADSSSESAIKDGESFQKDPLWTLLSKMKMIPRIAELLQTCGFSNHKRDNSIVQLPKEAFAAICGILAMMCHRSPGAASAIAQHETLTKDLLSLALQEDHEQSSLVLEKSTFLPVVILFSTLARQSSVAAQALEEPHAEDLMLKALALKPKDAVGAECQRWCLIFWRTLLRYGLGLQFLDLVLTITASQVAVDVRYWECRNEFFSCLSAAKVSFPDIAVERLLSAVVGAIDCVESLVERIQSKNKAASKNVLSAAICLDFIASCEATGGSTLSQHLKDKETLRLKKSLLTLVSSDFFSDIATNSFRGFLSQEGDFDHEQLQLDAAQCKLVLSLLAIAAKGMPEDWKDLVVDHFVSRAEYEAQSQPPASRSRPYPEIRLQSSWRNRCHTEVLTAMLEEQKKGKQFDFSVLVGLGCALIGRFDVGEEALADELLRGLCWMEPQNPSSSSFQKLTTMLLRNLRATNDSRAQLDHSSTLLGHTLVEGNPSIKPTALKTVLSGPSMKSSEFLLPVGRNWLWKVLAGSTEGTSQVSGDFLEVLRAACNAIRYLESEASDEVCLYSKHVNTGVKMYYVTNICLHDEQLLEQGDIIDLADSLLFQYSLRFDTKAAGFLVKECALHAGKAKEEVDETLTEDEEKVKKWLLEDPTEGLKDVIGFLGDICKAYTEFGVQYGTFFTRCVRTFLLPAFPSKVRCEVCRKMEGLLHLLTLENNDEELKSNLVPYIFLPTTGSDETPDDDSQWLDLLADPFPVGYARRPDMRFMETLSLCILGRNLLRCLQQKQSPSLLELARSRLDRTDHFFARSVVEVALRMTQEEEATWIESALSINGESPINGDKNTWKDLLSTLSKTSL